MVNEDDDREIETSEDEIPVAKMIKKKKKKRLTPRKTLDRIKEITSLKSAAGLLIFGIILSALWALSLYRYTVNWESGDEMNWFHNHGGTLIYSMYLGMTLLALYIATSIAYRPRFTKDEDGDEVKKELEFPEEGIEGTISRISQFAVPIFALLVFLSVISVFLEFWTGRDEYNVFEGHKTVYLTGIISSFIPPLLPMTILLIFLSCPRGLKRLDLYSKFLLIAGVCLIISVIFSLYLHTELFQYYKDIDDGNWMSAKMSEFAGNYADPISGLFELGLLGVGAIVISNMRLKRSKRIKFKRTPGMMMFLLGALMFILSMAIRLTIFNTDFDYSGDLDGWGAWYLFLGYTGKILLHGSLLLLMVEYSISRKITTENLAQKPGELWEEIKEQNPVVASRFE